MHIDEWGNRVSDKGANPLPDWRKPKSKVVTLKMKEVAERKRRERLAWQAGYDQAVAEMNKGFIWTAYGMDHEPIREYKQLFAFDRSDAMSRFKREYGNDSSIFYLVADTFNQWEY